MPTAPGKDGVLLASLACYEAASRAFEGTLEDDNYDEITQVTRSWVGLLKPSHDADMKARVTQDSGFVDIAIALSRLVPPKGSSGVSPTVLEKEVKVFRDPEEEAQGVFLLRALTHLCKELANHEPSCVVVESCDLRLVLVLHGGDKPMARPVVCFNPNPSRGGRARFHASEGKQPALMHCSSLKDAQAHVLSLLQSVWLRQSSGVGGHVSLWVVLRRGDTSPTLIDHVQALRKKEKAMAIMKRRRELERLASRIMHTNGTVEQDRDRTLPAMRASSRGGEGKEGEGRPETHAASRPETDEDESLAAYKAKATLRPPSSTPRVSSARMGGDEGVTPRGEGKRGPPEADGPASLSSRGGRGGRAEGQGEPRRPVGDEPRPRRPTPRGVDEGKVDVERHEARPLAKASPVPCPSASGEVSSPPSSVPAPGAARDQRLPSASSARDSCKASPVSGRAGVEGAPSPLEVQGREEGERPGPSSCLLSPALEALGSVATPMGSSLLLESIEAEDMAALSRRVYEAVKCNVLKTHASRPTSQGTEDDRRQGSSRAASAEGRVRASPRLGASLDSGLELYHRGEGKQQEDHTAEDAKMGGSREGGEEEEELEHGEMRAPLGSSVGEEGQWEELGEDRVSALLESMDGEDIEVFGRRLYRACRAAALRGAGVPRQPAVGEEGPRVASPLGPIHAAASPVVEQDASPVLSHSPAAPRARSPSPQRSPSPSPAHSPAATSPNPQFTAAPHPPSPLLSNRGLRRSPPSDNRPATAEPSATPTPRQCERSVKEAASSPLSGAEDRDERAASPLPKPPSRCSSTGAKASPTENRPRSGGVGPRGEEKARERDFEDKEEEEEEPGVELAVGETGAEVMASSRGYATDSRRSPAPEGSAWEFGDEEWAVVIDKTAGDRRGGSRAGGEEVEVEREEEEEAWQEDGAAQQWVGEEEVEEEVMVPRRSQGRGYAALRRCYDDEVEHSCETRDDEPSPPPSYRDDRPTRRPFSEDTAPPPLADDRHAYPPSRSYELEGHGSAYAQQGEGQGSESVSPGEYDRYDRYHRASYDNHPPQPLEDTYADDRPQSGAGGVTPLARSLESGEFAGGAWGGEEASQGHGPSSGGYSHHDQGYVDRQRETHGNGRGESRSPGDYGYPPRGHAQTGHGGMGQRGPPSDDRSTAYPHAEPLTRPLQEEYGSVAPGEYASGMGSAYRQPPTTDATDWAHSRPLSRPSGAQAAHYGHGQGEERSQGPRRDEWAERQHAHASRDPYHRHGQQGPSAAYSRDEGKVAYEMSPEGPYTLEDEEEADMYAPHGTARNGQRNGPLTHPLEASDGLMWEPRGPNHSQAGEARGPRAVEAPYTYSHEGRKPVHRETRDYDSDYDHADRDHQGRQPHALSGYQERAPPPPTAPSPPLPPPSALGPVPPAYIPPPRSPIPRRRPHTYPRPQNVGGFCTAPAPMVGRYQPPPPSAPLPPPSFLPQLQPHHAPPPHPSRPQHHMQPQHSWVGPAEPQACVPTTLPSISRGVAPSFLAVRTGGAMAVGPAPPRRPTVTAAAVTANGHAGPVPPRRSYSDGDATAASASQRHPRHHAPDMGQQQHMGHGQMVGGQWPAQVAQPYYAGAYPEEAPHAGRGQGHRLRDTRHQQPTEQEYMQAWAASPSLQPPAEPVNQMYAEPPAHASPYPPAPHPPQSGHPHAFPQPPPPSHHPHQPLPGPQASQWNGWAPQHDAPLPQAGHRHAGQGGLLEWDVEGSQSPEEQRRRQAKLEAVRARKMKEAQEREEARRQRQQQQSQPSQRRASLDEGPQADYSRPSLRAAAARPTSPDHEDRPSTVGTKAAAVTSAPAGVAAPAPAGGVARTAAGRRLSGPGAAVKGRGLSNAKLIRNALQHVCLAGTIMAPQRQKALESMDGQQGGVNFLVLFNSSNALTFRGLYVLEGASGSRHDSMIRRVFGAGPMFIKDEWVEHFYKYNSAARTFQPLPCGRSFTLMTDGLTLDLSKLRRAAKDGLANATSNQHAEQAAKA